jgi:aminoglycoside 2'-N-acetyltransferase I
MRRLAADAAEEYTIAGLESDIPRFYERLGWQRWRGALAGRRAEALVPTPEQRGVMVLRFPHTPSLDLDRSMTIECQPLRIW